jgi:lysine 2,3-aminomutase
MTIYSANQQEIAEKIAPQDAGLPNWKDWKWQLKNSVQDIDSFEALLGVTFSEEKRKKLELTLGKFPLSITPYYLSLIDAEDFENDPVFKQAFPSPDELCIERHDMSDPLAEDKDSPAAGITHRYPDRVLFTISNVCSMYCRHCTRKRKVGDVDSIPGREQIEEGLDYIRNTPEVRDVLLSGGDPLMLNDDYLDWILTELRKIEHVQIIRIGSRMPVVLPYRITDDLVAMLKKHHPVWLNTHFNHPREITASSREALRMLADAGIPLGNQTVLLAGVNDCPRIMKALVHKLVENRVRP